MGGSRAKVIFRIVIGILLLSLLYYVGRPLYWKISATVHDIRHNKQTVSQGFSQIVQAAQNSVGWFHDESDTGVHDDGFAAARRILLQFASIYLFDRERALEHIQVWDRRCFGTRGKAAGILIGHLEGITYIDTRGDGRYLISNGKDQAIKLWDIRKMSSNINYSPRPRSYDWDYRWMDYPEHVRNKRNPHDLSLATYKGHSVLRTLIRCYFSPAHSTGQKFIYTGSSDSSVYIYDVVSGAQVAKLDYHQEPVRDCNWHPCYPMLISSGWDGIIANWEFPGTGTSPVPVRPRARRSRRS